MYWFEPKYGLGYIFGRYFQFLGDIFTSSSGHTALKATID
jgi:hypothetical protein